MILGPTFRLRLRDPFAGLSHLAGAGLAVAGLIVLLIAARGRPWHAVSYSIYGASLILLFFTSGVFHLFPHSPRRIEQWLRLDQAAIYLLIAGTYTPICLLALRGPWGWSFFGAAWALAVLGIVLRFAWKKAPEWIGLGLYLLMGWLCVIGAPVLVKALTSHQMQWLVAGGLVYSLGAVVYATDRPRLWPGRFSAHDLWHVMVLAAGICHFQAVWSLAG